MAGSLPEGIRGPSILPRVNFSADGKRLHYAASQHGRRSGLLYQLYDWQRAALEPWRALAQAANEFYGHPTSPLSCLPGSRNVAAAMDLVGRLTQRYERPAFGFGPVRVGGRELAVREVFDLEKPFCRLLHFVKDGAPAQPKVLVFAPLSGHFATLLRDTVKSLLADHDV